MPLEQIKTERTTCRQLKSWSVYPTYLVSFPVFLEASPTDLESPQVVSGVTYCLVQGKGVLLESFLLPLLRHLSEEAAGVI